MKGRPTAGNVLFLDLAAGSLDVFSCEHRDCTFCNSLNACRYFSKSLGEVLSDKIILHQVSH